MVRAEKKCERQECTRKMVVASDRSTPCPKQVATTRAWPKLSRYTIESELGRGGMGVVYKAYDQELKRPVAIKMILHHAIADAETIARFRFEAEAIARLNHPHIVRIFETSEYQTCPFLVLEYLDGGTLHDRVARQPMEARKAAELIASLADAVGYAHRHGVIHRDLKPGNILFLGEFPKITDFGLAKLEDAAESYTRTGHVIGTPNYMAPEQAGGVSSAIGPPVDIYALGAVLYELLTGRPPYDGDTPMEILRLLPRGETKRLRSLCPSVPRDLETICEKCMRKEPRDRYRSAEDVAEELRRFLQNEPILARPMGVFERLYRWVARNPAIAASIFVFAFFLVSFAIASSMAAEQFRKLAQDENAARTTAEQSRNEARWRLYQASLAAAGTSLQLDNAESAAQALEAAPPEHRGWEWDYFHAQLDHSVFSWRGVRGPACYGDFTRDGKYVVVVNAEGIQVYSAETRGLVVSLPQKTMIGTPDHDVHPIKNQFLYGNHQGKIFQYDLEEKRLREWDIAVQNTDYKHPWIPKYSKSGNYVVFRKQYDDRLVVCTADGAVKRVISGRADGSVVAFSDQDRHLIVPMIGGKICVFDIETGNIAGTFDERVPNANDLKLNSTETVAASVEQHPHLEICLWDFQKRKLIAKLQGHSNTVSSLEFSPDGEVLASVSMDQTARLWEAKTGRLLAILRGHTQRLVGVAFTPDGKRVITTSYDGTARLWEVPTGELLAVLRGHSAVVWRVSIARDGKKIVSSSSDGTARLWDLGSVNCFQVLGKHSSYVYGVAMRNDGKQVASGGWDKKIRLWDLETGQAQGEFDHPEIVVSVAYHPTCSRVVSFIRSPTDVGSGATEWTLAGQKLQFIPSMGGTWELDSNATYRPDGERILCGHIDGSVRLSPAHGFQGSQVELGQPESDGRPVTGFMAWHPAGREFAVGAQDGSIRIFDGQSHKMFARLTKHTGGIFHLTYSPDGRYLISSSGDRNVIVWEVSTRNVFAILRHGSSIHASALHPNQKRLVTACADNSIRVWDFERFEEVAQLRGHTAYVHSVAFTPMGERLISGSGDGTVRVWDSRSMANRFTRTEKTSEVNVRKDQ